MIRSTLCTGIERSGSTWCYNVCRLLLEAAVQCSGEKVFAAFHDSERLDRFLANDPTGLFVIKTHSPGPRAMAFLGQSRVANVCSFRDPRDCVASKMRFHSLRFEDAVKVLRANIVFLKKYMEMSDVHFVRYEDMISDRINAIGRIAVYLNADIPQASLERIDRLTSPEASQQIVDTLTPDNPTTYREGSFLVDRVYLLHRNHLQGGEVGRWKRELNEIQREAVIDEFRDVLAVLGYEQRTVSPSVHSVVER